MKIYSLPLNALDTTLLFWKRNPLKPSNINKSQNVVADTTSSNETVTEKDKNLDIVLTSKDDSLQTSTSAMDEDLLVTTPNALDTEHVTVLETEITTAKPSNINKSQNVIADTTSQSYITTPSSNETVTEKDKNLDIVPTSKDDTLQASTSAMDADLLVTTPNALDTEHATVLETEITTAKPSNINKKSKYEILTEATTTNDINPIDKELSRGNTTENHEGDTSQSNTVQTEASLITDKILTEVTTANDIRPVDKESSGGKTTENPQATTSNIHPITEQQQVETTSPKDHTTQLSMSSTPQLITIPKGLEDAETSESNTVPTQSSLITDKILEEATTANGIGLHNKESSAGNQTENPEGTTTNFHLKTEEQQEEITTTKDQTTQPNVSSTPQMITTSKELTASDVATEMIDSTRPTTHAWQQTENQVTTVEMKDKITSVGIKFAEKTSPGPSDILTKNTKIEGVTKAYSEFTCKTTWGYYPDPKNCAGFIQWYHMESEVFDLCSWILLKPVCPIRPDLLLESNNKFSAMQLC
ncbi:unnamed protein product [Mytilus coruscus]|uniref:Uncharacterized protein n=1 Tax=Mytilus coruscus TaxID=42192 RepID=A0A6J8DJQ4_MYTCO|nr:unnamed protein product [Mytilus coruscus]